MLGQALCEKDVIIGCTFAGMSYLSQTKAKEGQKLLTMACDKFEPFACRSLGRLMKTAGQSSLSHLYFKRACYYGLKEICRDLSKGKSILSQSGNEFLGKIKLDCSDTKSSACSDRLNALQLCKAPLSKEDCVLLPGFLSIFFRAKLMQEEAKFQLNTLLAAEKKLKLDPKLKAYSFDLEVVMKGVPSQKLYHYVFGFNLPCSGEGTATSLELYRSSYQHMDSRSLMSIRKEFSKGKSSDCYDSQWGFEAFAVASLDPLHPEQLDIWKINQDGNLIQLKDGLPK